MRKPLANTTVLWLDNYMTSAAATVETYNLQTRTGRHIRKATKVTFVDGRTVEFVERMSKREAIRQATNFLAREA